MIVLCIPGPWSDQAELLKLFLNKHGFGYSLSDGVLLEKESGNQCRFQFASFDEELVTYFKETADELSAKTLGAVSKHPSSVTLTSEAVGFEATSKIAALAAALLDLGGYGVLVKSSGKSHEAAFWQEHWEDDDPLIRYNLFITLAADEFQFYSCGMHQFGLADVSVNRTVGDEEGSYVLNAFNLFNLIESYDHEDGDTFVAGEDEPLYIMISKPYPDEDADFQNPNGCWHLEPVEN